MNFIRWFSICNVFFSFLLSSNSRADQLHYNNVLVGERAQGLGGAYTAVADDASGVVYNPAGLAFAQSNDNSGSANAFYEKKTTYKEAFLGKDFTEKSGGTFAPFFGATQKLDKFVTGLSAGFAFYAVDTDIKDQDDLIENVSQPFTQPGTDVIGEQRIDRYHRTANSRASTSALEIAAAYRVAGNFALGLSIGIQNIDELDQVFQDRRDVYTLTNSVTNFYFSQNVRQRLRANGLTSGIGAQISVTPKLSIGAVVKGGQYVWQHLEFQSEKRTQSVTTKKDPTTGVITSEAVTCMTAGTSYCAEVSTVDKKPLGTMPINARVGLAYFASQRLLMTADANYYSKSSNSNSQYLREQTYNLAAGAEYYLTPSIPVRAGLFTNNSAAPKMNPSDYPNGQPDHVDYKGASLFFAFVQPNSQVALGGFYQMGSGEARKTGLADIQTVVSNAYTTSLSATHSF